MKTVTLVFCYGARTTKGKSSSPESFIDASCLKVLEQERVHQKVKSRVAMRNSS